MPSVSVVLYLFVQFWIAGVAVRLVISSAVVSIIFQCIAFRPLGAWSSRPLSSLLR